MNCNRIGIFFQSLRRLLKSRSGTLEWETPERRPALCYVIDGVKYIVTAYFRKDTILSAEDKIGRLIDKDMENAEEKK